MSDTSVKGGVKLDHWGGGKVDQFTGGWGRATHEVSPDVDACCP